MQILEIDILRKDRLRQAIVMGTFRCFCSTFGNIFKQDNIQKRANIQNFRAYMVKLSPTSFYKQTLQMRNI